MKRTLILLAAVSTVLIACGGDDDDDTAAATTAGGAATTAAGGSTGGSAEGENSEYCIALTEFKATRDEYAPVLASGTATPEEIETAITAQRESFEALLDTAPADIQGDMNGLAGPTFAFFDALQEVGYDLGAMTTDNAAANEALNQLNSPQYIEASESVDAYGIENCGIKIGE